MHLLHRHLRGLSSLVFTGECPLCQRSTTAALCQNCQRQVQRCQLSVPVVAEVSLPVFAWGAYAGALKRAIAALKYQDHPQLSRPLAHWLAASWLATYPALRNLCVVPIPMHREKQNQRGFNQAELIARHFCQFTRLPLVSNGLERPRETLPQFQLSAAERQQNLTGAFAVGTALLKHQPTAVLLLDDIYTTGATARCAAQVLQAQGIQVKGIAVVARSLSSSSV